MSPERRQPSEIEKKLYQQINVLQKSLSHKEVKLSKINQQLKHLRTEGKYLNKIFIEICSGLI